MEAPTDEYRKMGCAEMPLALENETYLLRQCFFDVQNEVGTGRQEEAYHRACEIWFRNRNLPVLSRGPHSLLLKSEEVIRLFPDFVGWDSIVVELKSVPRRLNRSEFVQLFDYLKCRGNRVGLLVNMGLERVEIERIVHDPLPATCLEKWDTWSNRIQSPDRDIGLAIRKAFHSVYEEHTTGYGSEITQKLVHKALLLEGLNVVLNPIAKSFYHGIEVDESPLECLLVEKRIVLTLSALFDSILFAESRCRSFLDALGLTWGIAADFGKTQAEIVGVRSGV